MPVIETERLSFRELSREDFEDLCEILQDPEAMTAYEHAFPDAEVWEWLGRQQGRYCRYGFGLWAVTDRLTGEMVGQVGLTMQPTPYGRELELGYLLKRRFWHLGYATMAGEACLSYAYDQLGASRVTSIIRENNWASRRVAERLGMTPGKTFVKHYYGVDMPHIIYSIEVPAKAYSREGQG